MSGIAGIIHFDGRPVEPGLIEKMTAAMHYRGPDGMRHWQNDNVALGHCMLRTTPEALEETQPWCNEGESLVLILDGRVDNWIELRKDLLSHGLILRNRSDAELVLRSYELWGTDCVLHIDGDFAFVIWDAIKKIAFCARDRMGNKPFYYHWNGHTLVFASELHPILKSPGIVREQNVGMLVEFIAGEWHSRDETLYKEIFRLVAAHRISAEIRRLEISNYWQPDLNMALPYQTEQEYFDHYRCLLFDCVRRMSRAQGPLAIEVSGGLDSSATFAVAQHLLARNELLADKAVGYSLLFDEDGDANELEYSREIGNYFKTDINEIPASLLPIEWFQIRAREYRDFPGFPNAAMFEGIRRAASARCSRVILTGEGGDQWLQGGDKSYYREELGNRNWAGLMTCLGADIRGIGLAKTVSAFLRYGCFPLLPTALRSTLKKIKNAGNTEAQTGKFWLSIKAKEILDARRLKFSQPHPANVLNFGQLELLDTLQDAFTDHVMENVERLAARNGIELRHPFRCPEFVQFAFSTPERFRLRGGQTKYIHVKALEGLMPPKVLKRSSKAEFSLSVRPKLLGLSEHFLGDKPFEFIATETREDWPLLDPTGLGQLYSTFAGNDKAGWPLWPLWSIWACQWVDDEVYRGV